jgi:starch-binding outer membrane protein, SusD/RagB family
LYWASPQFNPADLTDRWQQAYEANKKAKELLVANGYRLHNSFEDMWFTEVNNPEAVFVTGYNNSTNDQQRKNNTWDNGTRPSYLGTSGGSNQPTKEMVDAFPMKDGKKINDASSKYAYDPQLFYKNRDPRFDKTIAYNGTTWNINGNSSYRLWTYIASNKSVEPKATNTGFYTRKAIDKNAPIGNVQYLGTDWMEIRFAEVLLNLAESACGVNKLDEAYAELKEIRKRAGIEAGDDGMYGLQTGMSRDEMMAAILYERQLEFAFEGKRYWDLRRHKLFESVLNGKRRTGITITLKSSGVPADFATNRDKVNLDEAYTKYFAIATKSLDTKYAINWKPEYYFFALPQQALDNNPNLEQTLGWNGGTFDPLK